MVQYAKVAIIVSTQDPAGMNIKQRLLELFSFEKGDDSFEGEKVYRHKDISLYTTKKQTIDCNYIDNEIEADLFVFATKHRAESGTHSLSVHVPGNWGKAQLGGFDRKLCIVPASLIRMALLELTKRAEGMDYEVTVEATHHGPYLDKPCFFIEIGSSEEQWKNEKAAKTIAETIISVMEKREESHKTVMVLGGGHYNQTTNKVILRTDYAVGHICAKYALGDLDTEMLQKAVERTVEKVECVVLDWKGLGDKKEHVKKLLEETGIKTERSKTILHD